MSDQTRAAINDKDVLSTTDPLRADCIGGGYAYVGHGEDCVMVAFTQEVGWWRNSVWFTPDKAEHLARRLLEQVQHARALDNGHAETPPRSDTNGSEGATP